QTVGAGGDGTEVTAVPEDGFAFASWSDGSRMNPRIDRDVMMDISVTATFGTASTYTYLAGTGGEISGETPQSIVTGESGTPVTAVPNEGFVFVNWSDGETDNPRTDTGGGADVTVTANFTSEIILTYTAGAN